MGPLDSKLDPALFHALSGRIPCLERTSFFWRPAEQPGCFSISDRRAESSPGDRRPPKVQGGPSSRDSSGWSGRTNSARQGTHDPRAFASKSAMKQMAAELARWGSDCYLIDLPGHGDSPERFSFQATVSTTDQAVRELLSGSNGADSSPPPLVVIGHSFGARAALGAAHDIHELLR